MDELVEAIKIAAVEAVDSGKPVSVCFGTVVSASPLKISVEQKLALTEAQLWLCRNVTDFETEISADWESENAEGHSHAVKGNKKITVHNGLAVGDQVLLLRQQGGQKYIVWDRLI